MNRRTIVLLGAFALAAVSRPAGAQMTAAPSKTPAKQPVRTGSIPPSPPAQPIVVNTTGLPASNAPGSPVPTITDVHTNYVPVGVAQITYYPTVVLSDGRVMANFGTGRGYEQVLRQCAAITGTLPANATIAPCFTVDAYGAYRVMQRR